MNDGQIYDTPSDVTTKAGEVVVDGPDGVAVSLTPNAAVETGSRLIDAAAEAHGKAEIDNGRRKYALPVAEA
jgi:hypothetical protein